MTKLFVGGLPYTITNQQLQEMFAKFGQVSSAMIITDKFTGQSKGFGFVEMDNDEEAQNSIKDLNGTSMENRTIGVSVARPREERPNQGGFNRAGGGGFNRDDNRGGGGFNRGSGGDRGRGRR